MFLYTLMSTSYIRLIFFSKMPGKIRPVTGPIMWVRYAAIAASIIVIGWAGYNIYTMGLSGFVEWLVGQFVAVFTGLFKGIGHIFGL